MTSSEDNRRLTKLRVQIPLLFPESCDAEQAGSRLVHLGFTQATVTPYWSLLAQLEF